MENKFVKVVEIRFVFQANLEVVDEVVASHFVSHGSAGQVVEHLIESYHAKVFGDEAKVPPIV